MNSKVLWQPDEATIQHANLTKYLRWLEGQGKTFATYQELYAWSTEDLEGFWSSMLEYFDVLYSGDFQHVFKGTMPDVKWFTGLHLNYAEHIFRNANSDSPAILFASENRELQSMSWEELRSRVAGLQVKLREFGVKPGDRVAGWLPNIPEAIIAFLATNSLGAIWSSTSPDFGNTSVIDRFAQIEPRVLIVADGYSYNGKVFDKMADNRELIANLPTVEHTILIPFIKTEDHSGFHKWADCTQAGATLSFERLPFEHPIWVLYSSGTTGLPKAITHSAGGVLLEHLKYLSFHNDVKPGERFFWYTTTGWMMWNYMVASMLCGATVVIFEGSPAYPSLDRLWLLTEEAGINHFGTSAPFIVANMKAGQKPSSYDLSTLRSIGSTGAPLPPEGFEWISNSIGNIWLASISGGTDVCSAFVGGNPLLPVHSGEIQCAALGCDLKAYNESGEAVLDEVGEMIIEKPMPSMPVFFWNDKEFQRYTESYFEEFPDVWRHGDWIRITQNDGVVIYGRSDATLNRGGIRIGTAEIYAALDSLEEVKDALVVCIDRENGESHMPLFVVTDELDTDLQALIKRQIREDCSPRHVPDVIYRIDQVPYTISGKKTEAPVKKILMGKSLENSLNKDALKNPEALSFFIDLYEKGGL